MRTCSQQRELEIVLWGVESTLAVIGTGGPVKQSHILFVVWGVDSTLAVIGTGGPEEEKGSSGDANEATTTPAELACVYYSPKRLRPPPDPLQTPSRPPQDPSGSFTSNPESETVKVRQRADRSLTKGGRGTNCRTAHLVITASVDIWVWFDPATTSAFASGFRFVAYLIWRPPIGLAEYSGNIPGICSPWVDSWVLIRAGWLHRRVHRRAGAHRQDCEPPRTVPPAP
eukprot:1175666-Prorocentrum_minimum.AAC.5